MLDREDVCDGLPSFADIAGQDDCDRPTVCLVGGDCLRLPLFVAALSNSTRIPCTWQRQHRRHDLEGDLDVAKRLCS